MGVQNMPRSIPCIRCGVRLNVPQSAAGKRLRCPKCGAIFLAEGPGAGPDSSTIGVADAAIESRQDLPQIKAPAPVERHAEVPKVSRGSGKPGHGDLDMPTASGDLRETFDLPLLVDDDAPSSSSRSIGDAGSLFDDRPARRRVGAAEARSKARRCPTCGGVVPVGMSICSRCGLNLETGIRIDLDEDLLPPPPPRPAGTPMGITILGGLCFLGSVLLTFAALVQSLRAEDGTGFQLLALVCIFGVYASVQFLRGKSTKLLLVALSLGVLINTVAMIALPIFDANSQTTIVQRVGPPESGEDEVVIQSVAERLDTDRITLGILGLITYAAASVYLTSPSVRRHFAHRAGPP